MPKHSRGGGEVAGVVAPPPLIYLGFLLLGVLLRHFCPLAIFGDAVPTALRAGIGAAAIVLGLAIGMAGLRLFREAGTNVRPERPTTRLLTQGLYRYSRNPLYGALALVYLGATLAIDNLWSLAFLLPALLVIRYGVIAREEAYLEQLFGDDYRRYKAAVRRWL